MPEPLILHEYSVSGNCYKIRLTAALLGIELDRREYDILKGETRTPHFLDRINANGRIPVLQIGERFLPESNAACCWLADGSPLIPSSRFDHADMLRWMFFEQYNHEPNIATLRFWRSYVGADRLTDEQRAAIPAKEAGGLAALSLMNRHLEKQDWFVGNSVTLADICLHAYTHVAGEGGFDLHAFPAVEAWLERIAALPRFTAMDGS
ncbi:MAG: glutathione S-transferase family protein [Sphingobium sp.]